MGIEPEAIPTRGSNLSRAAAPREMRFCATINTATRATMTMRGLPPLFIARMSDWKPTEVKKSVMLMSLSVLSKENSVPRTLYDRSVRSETTIPPETGAGTSEKLVRERLEDQVRGQKGKKFAPGKLSYDDGKSSWMTRLKQSTIYFDRTDCTAYLTRQAYVLKTADRKADRLVSLPKYTAVHLTGTGNAGYVRIEMDGIIRYMESDSVTTDTAAVKEIRAQENLQADRGEFLTKPVHLVKESELSRRAEDVHEETDKILAEIAFQEMIRTQTRNPNWGGPVLSRSNGSVKGPNGKETYYNLNMNGVVNIMRRLGNTDEYWVRDDGCKMLGNYIMCAANLGVHPRGSLVESSLGTCIVCDTGGFARGNSQQLDIAVTW